MKRNTYVVMVASAAALGGFLFGFDTAIINGTVTALRKYFSADSVQIGLAVSLALVGSAIGAFFAGRLADRIGRVKVMIRSRKIALVKGLQGQAAAFRAPRPLSGRQRICESPKVASVSSSMNSSACGEKTKN